MHLFGLNWQLQQTENDTFENGKVNSDTVPTHTVALPSGDSGKAESRVACVCLWTSLAIHLSLPSFIWKREKVLKLQMSYLKEQFLFIYLNNWKCTLYYGNNTVCLLVGQRGLPTFPSCSCVFCFNFTLNIDYNSASHHCFLGYLTLSSLSDCVALE